MSALESTADYRKFGPGTKVLCDFWFGGKPEAVVTEIIKPGSGKRNDGKVRVRMTQTSGAWHKGEIREISTGMAVPRSMIRPRQSGEFFMRCSTRYQFV